MAVTGALPIGVAYWPDGPATGLTQPATLGRVAALLARHTAPALLSQLQQLLGNFVHSAHGVGRVVTALVAACPVAGAAAEPSPVVLDALHEAASKLLATAEAGAELDRRVLLPRLAPLAQQEPSEETVPV